MTYSLDSDNNILYVFYILHALINISENIRKALNGKKSSGNIDC